MRWCCFVVAAWCVGCAGSDPGQASSSSSSGSSSGGGPGQQVTITLDELVPTTGVTVDNQYLPHARFVTDPGYVAQAYAPPSSVMLPSEPMVLTVQRQGDTGQYALEQPLEVQFPNGARDVRFYVTGVNSQGRFATAVATPVGGAAVQVMLQGLGTPAQPVLVDLSAHGTLQSVRIQDIQDNLGIGYDSFSFVVP